MDMTFFSEIRRVELEKQLEKEMGIGAGTPFISIEDPSATENLCVSRRHCGHHPTNLRRRVRPGSAALDSAYHVIYGIC